MCKKTNWYPTECNGWFLTDDDCFQYCKPIDEIIDGISTTIYQFLQIIQINDNKYNIVIDTIDIYDYINTSDELSNEIVIDIISSYGYGMNILRGNMDNKEWAETLLKEFKKQNGPSWRRIFTECVFETLTYSGDVIESNLTKEQMRKKLIQYLEEN